MLEPTSTLSNPDIRFNNGVQIVFVDNVPIWAQPIGQETMRSKPGSRAFETYWGRYQAPPEFRQTNGHPAQACQNRVVISFNQNGQPVQAEHLDEPRTRCTPEDNATAFNSLLAAFYALQTLTGNATI